MATRATGMTERKPRDISFASWVDQQIAEAAEQGAFDYLRREGVSADELLPTPLRLRKEIERLAGTVGDLSSEDEVREVVRGLNRRILEWRRIPTGPPVYLRLVGEEAMVGRWREARRRPAALAPAVRPDPDPDPPRRRRWWRRGPALRPGVPQRPRRQLGPVGQPQLRQGAADVALDGPLGQDQPASDGPVGEAVGDEFRYLPFAPGQRIAGSDGLLELTGEAAGPAGRAGHVQAARLGGGLPGEFPGPRQVLAGAAVPQRSRRIQPGQGDQGPGAEPGVHRLGRGEVIQRQVGPAQQRRQPAQRPVQR